MSAIVPVPRISVSVREATMKDIPFIDQLQKMHGHMVGWMPTKQLEGKVEAKQVIVASCQLPVASNSLATGNAQLATPVGYCISQDHYMGRDDVGIIYHLNVLPLRQRNLIGATLVKAAFERAAYGCRLFCLWCAQDIQANYFWESIGFVPLAFRTGSASKQRIHIFWQKRIRENDTTTDYWYPAETKNGSIGDSRLVMPIPPGTNWRDAKPILLPGMNVAKEETPKTLPGGAPVRPRPEQPKVTTAHKMAVVRSQSKHLQGLPPGKAAVVTSGGLRYIDRGDHVPEQEAPKQKRPSKPRAKNDPALVAKVRELRDRWLEQVSSNPSLLLPVGKYEVCKAIALTPEREVKQLPIAA